MNGSKNYKELKNLLVVDPNPCDMESVALEDLSIAVDLEVYKRNNEIVIFDNSTEKTFSQGIKTNKTRISLIDNNNGKDGDKTYLNTNYTELNTSFNKENEDFGGLGIENIDISFNASLAPMVKIKFKDIRGKLFEQGNKSPYSFLFKMPYPIFYLTIKGYYGQPIQYALHMLKFSAALDGETGSFIISCEFIGYTYAFLTDMLMGYLKAIPYTSYGKKLVKAKEGWETINGEEVRTGDEFITFEKLKHIISTLQINVEIHKNSDKKINGLAIHRDAITKLNLVEGEINSFIGTLSNGVGSSFDKAGDVLDSNKIVFIREPQNNNPLTLNIPGSNTNTKSKVTTNIDKLYDGRILKAVTEYNDFNIKKGNGNRLDIEGYQYNNKGLYYIDSLASFPVENVDYSGDIINFQPQPDIPLNDSTNESINQYYLDFKTVIYSDQFSKIFKFGIPNVISSNVFSIFDFRNVLKELQILRTKIEDERNLLKEEINVELLAVIKETLDDLNFDPSIGTIFKMLCDHVDIFINSIRTVATEVVALKGSDERKLSYYNQQDLPEWGKDNFVSAFPEYLEDSGANAYVDKWLGHTGSKFINSPEVKFINELYDGLLLSRKDDIKFINQTNQDVNGWYPVNPFDSKILNNGTTNPWKMISESSDINVIHKLLIERMVIFLGYTNSDLSDNEITTMATIETDEMIRSIVNHKTKLALRDFHPNSTPDEKIDKILAALKIENFFITNPDYDSGLLNQYQYVFSYSVPIVQRKIDLESIGRNPNNYNQADLVTGNFDKTSLTDFVEIIDENTYVNKTNYRNIEEPSEIKPNYVYGGKFRTTEYLNTFKFYSDRTNTKGNRKTDSPTTKYDTFNRATTSSSVNFNSTKINTSEDINLIRGKSDWPSSFKIKLEESYSDSKNVNGGSFIYRPELIIRINRRVHSLFGSEFYYSQEQIGRAYLFLHSLPLEGMGVKIDASSSFGILGPKVKEYFDKRGGAVKVPTAWALFMGALLQRAEGEIINFNSVPTIAPSPIDSYLNRPFARERGAGFNPRTTYVDSGISIKDADIVEDNKVDSLIIELPNTVKTEFKKLFNDWVKDVDNGFEKIQNELEIVNNVDELQSTWNFLNSTGGSNQFKPNTSSNYIIAGRQIGTNMDIFLETRDDSSAKEVLINFLLENKVIINATYRTWIPQSRNSDGLELPNSEIPIDEVKTYLGTYFRRLAEITNDVKIDETAVINQELFNTTRIDDIKLNLYKNVKSIYDKWIVGIDGDDTDVVTNFLYNRFKFIDRSFKDISSLFKISPNGLLDQLTVSHNVTFYNFIAKILSANNFDFHPLPTYINYNSAKEVSEVFTPQPFNEAPKGTLGPQFICMYIGERSSRLSIEESYGVNKNDGWNVTTTCNNGNLGITEGLSNIPNDVLDTTEKSGKIPYFLVKYGDQNQSMFKNIKLDQMEFSETDEGLQIMDSLANSGKNQSVGQNLFDIYTNRSYSAEVEMLGCAQIQPFMYFQLDNIPMFTGAYTIINVSHSIKANHMTTRFKGTRLRYAKTKMIGTDTLFANLIGKIDEGSSENANRGDYKTNSEVNKAANTVEETARGKFGPPMLGVDEMIVVSDFGERKPLSFHYGIDFRAKTNIPIMAVAEGTIEQIQTEDKGADGGRYIIVKVDKVKAGITSTKDIYYGYFHLSEIPSNIKKDVIVKKEEILGETGKSGNVVPHLHMIVAEGDWGQDKNRKNPQWYFEVGSKIKSEGGWSWEPKQIRLS